MFRPRPIRILYGKPMDLSGMSRDEVVETIGRVFASMLQELRSGRMPLDRRDL